MRTTNTTKKKTIPRSSTGYKGVYTVTNSKKYRAEATINGKYKHIGCYKTPLAAHRARLKFLNNIVTSTYPSLFKSLFA